MRKFTEFTEYNHTLVLTEYIPLSINSLLEFILTFESIDEKHQKCYSNYSMTNESYWTVLFLGHRGN